MEYVQVCESTLVYSGFWSGISQLVYVSGRHGVLVPYSLHVSRSSWSDSYLFVDGKTDSVW